MIKNDISLILEKNNINIKLNNELKEILNSIELNSSNLDKLRQINWKILENQFYNPNFIEFLKYEFGINSEKLFEKQDEFDIASDLQKKCDKFDIEVLFDYIREGKKNTITDFTLYFNHRIEFYMKYLEDKIDIDNLCRISQISSGESVTIVGLVSDMWNTKYGKSITLEDKSGSTRCYINQNNNDLMSIVKKLCLDEVIAIKGRVNNGAINADEIILPSFDDKEVIKKTKNENYVLALSDLHIGTKDFEDTTFDKFINFLNGESKSKKLKSIAKKIKYVLIAGDIIEGIGIYPNQGRDARFLSASMQYRYSAYLLSKIPKEKCIVIIPGNHDTTRLSEPQLKMSYDKTYSLYNQENVIILSNPSTFKLYKSSVYDSLNVSLYHGSSFFYYGDKIDYLREAGGVNNLGNIMKYLLSKHHFAPSYGATLCFPDDQEDSLIIKEIPDFLITGHVHKMSFSNYKNCSMLSCSGWSKQSEYQKSHGLMPDIGKCFLINTKTRKPQILNFYKEE